MDVVIYARYSSHSQTEQSIEGQLKECHRYAENNGYNVVGEYIDRALSGTTDNRPKFLKMIEDSNKKFFNGVIVYQLDRFARNRYDSATYKNRLKKNDVRVFSARENISDDASGVLMESVLEGMAEYYSAELSQKVKRGMDINATKFLYNGGIIPIGLRVDENKKYQIDENTAIFVRKVFDMYLEGYTMADIIKYLNEKQINTSMGNKFNKGSVRCILINKKYIGIYSYKGKDTPNIIPKIIDEEIFYKVQDMLEKNKRAPARAKAKVEYILTTKLFCGKCKDMMVGISGTSRNKNTYNYYSCNGKRKNICNKKNVSKEYIEDLVVEQARNILTDDNIDKISKAVFDISQREKNQSDINRLNNLIKENEKQKNNLINSLKICDNDIVRKSIFEEIAKMEEEHKEIETSIRKEEVQQINITIPEIKFFLNEMRKGNINDLKYRKMLVNVLINKVYLYDDNIIIIFNTQKNLYEEKIPLIGEIESSFLGEQGPPSKKSIKAFISKMLFFRFLIFIKMVKIS